MTFLLLLPALILLAYLSWYWYEQAVILLVFLIPAYLLRTSLGIIPTNFFELGVAIVLILGLLQPSIRLSWKIMFKRIPRSFIVFLILFVLSAIISTVISSIPRVSLGILKSWIMVPIIFGFLVASLDKRERVMTALIWSGAVTALLAFPQIGQIIRLKSIYDVPNSLALWLAPIFVLALWRGFWGNNKKLNLLLAIPIGVAIVGTQSTVAIVSVLVALSIAVVIARSEVTRQSHPITRGIPRIATPRLSGTRNDVVIIMIILVLVSGLFLLWSGRVAYLTRPLFNHNTTNSISVRLQLWSVAKDLIVEHPILGVGLGQFEPTYQVKLHERFIKYEAGMAHIQKPISEFVFRDPHNWILSFWLNLGILGLVSFVGMNIFVLMRLYTNRHCEERSDAAIPWQNKQGILLALLMIIVMGLFDTIYWKNDLASLYWLLLFLAANNISRPQLI